MSSDRQAARKDDAAAARVPVEVVDLCSDDDGESEKENGVVTTEAAKPAGGKRKLSELERNPSPSSVAKASVAKPPPHIWMNDDHAIVTYGVLPLLQKNQQDTIQSPANSKVFLLTNSTLLQHIQQRDGWSCGFRNIQMLLSALIPLLPSFHPFFEATGHIYAQVPEHVFTSVSGNTDLLVLPSLMQLQMELERSWKQGFDPNGARHFQHSVVGRPSKIGAIEVGFLLAFWKIDAHVLQFIRCVPSRRLLPAAVFRYFSVAPHQTPGERTASLAQKCMEWAEQNWDSKSTASEILNATASTTTTGTSSVLPLYLQWEGHSVTIIGIEPPAGNAATHRTNDWNQWNLLILCPQKCGTQLKKKCGGPAAFRMSCRSLGRMDCQVLVAGWNALNQDERCARQKAAAATTAAQEAVTRASREF